ncbi:MAG: diphthine--ammonia ligase [Oscillospiraceae bacterium]|jgi:uncharacterized protein (TIGR00290 family)|nr:diphthine--ammonia ligase [Oscillospiraceae bacterium]
MGDKIKVAASYSGGKDSALALYRAINAGHAPVCLLTTYNEAAGRSWFHGVPREVLEKVSEALKIPLELFKTGAGDDYERDFKAALARAKAERGAQGCVFGDIDLQTHYDRCASWCAQTQLESLFPLWNGDRAALVYELIDAGFKAVITIVNTQQLGERFLGKTLTRELAAEIAAEGADVCGENGEYHTFVYDGPIFASPVAVSFGDTLRSGEYSILPVTLA